MDKDITIIDYGINNLKSVRKAFESINKTVEIVDSPEGILNAKCLVLPGIGAFANGMAGLKSRKLTAPIKKKISENTPILGICLGMQLLFERSEEFGMNEGLNLIEGEVIYFGKMHSKDNFKIPHMGWNELKFEEESISSEKSLLKNIPSNSNVYFVHSFYPIPKKSNDILTTTDYANQIFASCVQRNNIVGMQFHPEKSGVIGLNLLRNFCEYYNI